ncbi:TPA: hypothetical protein ACMGHP_002615 [Legionella pneumophila]|nr:hypothetical protein [Legionella pneumophila]HCX3330764.1 hypothetical protein [Legionella pneumophila]
MDSKTKDALANVLKEFGASPDEETLVNYANTHVTKETNHALIISLFILSKQIKLSTEQLVESNKKLAKASDKNSRKMVALTWALVVVGILQAISALISLFFHQ